MAKAKRHPDSGLTLRQAFERFFDKSDLAARTLETHRVNLSRWERLTDDPPLGRISNATLAEFRTAAIDSGLSPASVNNAWRTYRAILKLIGPPRLGCPWALGIIGHVVAMKPLREPHDPPRRITLDMLGRFYLSCAFADRPCNGMAPELWRAAVVLAYFTGLRKGDLLRLTPEHISPAGDALDVTARKTGRRDLFPLHPIAQAHVRRILRPGQRRLFAGMNPTGGALYRELHDLQSEVGITPEERFGWHDVRRTAASEADAAAPGIGATFLQHSPRDTSDRYYLNRSTELRQAVERMRYPEAFDLDCDAALQHAKRLRGDVLRSKDRPGRTDPAEWQWLENAFVFRGVRHEVRSSERLQLLHVLVTSQTPATAEELSQVMYGRSLAVELTQLVRHRVCDLRDALRSAFGLQRGCNPIPRVDVPRPSHHPHDGPHAGAWIVSIPAAIDRDSWGAAI